MTSYQLARTVAVAKQDYSVFAETADNGSFLGMGTVYEEEQCMRLKRF